LGTNRSKVLAESTSPDVVVRSVGMPFHVVPSVEYSHVPPESEFCVIAMPVSIVVVCWTLLLVKIAAIDSPAGFVMFSTTGTRVPAPTPVTSMTTA
jgi:hypothetical protein